MLRSHWALAASLLTTFGGCLVVAPLDELPPSTTDNRGGVAGQEGEGTAGEGATVAGAGYDEGGSDLVGGAPGKVDGTKPCSNNAECIARAGDAPAICRASTRTCVGLTTPACPLVYGNPADPHAIIFGSFATLDPEAPEESSILWAQRLALDELTSDDVGGLPGPQNLRRPLVMSVCNNVADALEPALSHLIDDLEVPAIVATLQPGDLRRAYEGNQKRDVFYLSPVSVTRMVALENDADHIWSLLGQPSDFAPTYASLVALSEAHVRALQSPEERGMPLRVALVTTEDAFDAELASAVTAALRFNGRSATDNGANFTRVVIGAKPNFTELALEVATWRPDIVISTAGQAFLMTNGLQQVLEENWAVGAGEKAAPFYILSPYDAGNLNVLSTRISGRLEREPNVDHNARYVGVSIADAVDNSLQNAYALRLRSKFKNAIADTANYYDAVYFLAYAMVGANQPARLTGTGIASGMRRLLSGDALDVGPGKIADAFATLAEGAKTLHLVSTLGPPDFDPATGVRPITGSVFCFKRVQNSAQLVTNALRYDPDAQALVGEAPFPCISGFVPP